MMNNPKFKDFGLSEALDNAISDMGFETPSEIQSNAIPLLLDHPGDFVGQAQTGTGKTAAFLIPLLERINPKNRGVQGLILTPTRELAEQVYRECQKLTKYSKIKSTAIYGGVSYFKQEKVLKQERPSIVVATPGRLIDLVDKRMLNLSECQYLVMDEADEMLNMGFLEDVETIISHVSEDRRLWMFSATVPPAIKALIDKRFDNVASVHMAKKTVSNADIEQGHYLVQKRDFGRALKTVIDSLEDCYGIAFCETRLETRQIADYLERQGLRVVALHGELSQAARDEAMNKFRKKHVQLMICTDVASRGIDVSNITHVFNMGLPRQREVYVHRIGRTGRAGMKGHAYSFVAPDQIRDLRGIEHLIRTNIPKLEIPEIREIKGARVRRELNSLEPLKGALLERGSEFEVDELFDMFQAQLGELDREGVLKLFFAHQFNRDFRAIESNARIATPVVHKRRTPGRFAKGGGRPGRGGEGYGSRGDGPRRPRRGGPGRGQRSSSEEGGGNRSGGRSFKRSGPRRRPQA